MTDRIKGCAVTFDRDVREDDADALIRAILQPYNPDECERAAARLRDVVRGEADCQWLIENAEDIADLLEAARAEIERARLTLIEVLREDPLRAVDDARPLPDVVSIASGDLRQFRAMINMLRRQLSATDDAYRASKP